MVPGARRALRRIGRTNDVITFVSHYARRRISAPSDRTRPWNTCRPASASTPSARIRSPGWSVRERYGLGDAPVLLSVSRLVTRKGQDSLIRAMPQILRRVPQARC